MLVKCFPHSFAEIAGAIMGERPRQSLSFLFLKGELNEKDI
jgi:hypothetical protein